MEDLKQQYLELYNYYISDCDFTMPQEFIERIINNVIQYKDHIFEKQLEKLEVKIKSELKKNDNAFESFQTWRDYKNTQKVLFTHKFIASAIARYAQDNNFALSKTIEEVLSGNEIL